MPQNPNCLQALHCNDPKFLDKQLSANSAETLNRLLLKDQGPVVRN